MDSQNRNVLVVDDDPAVRRFLRAMLDPIATVHEAENGEAAIEAVLTSFPDLVLLDIVMPGLDGYETCRQIKAATSQSLPPQVVMVSQKSKAEEQAKAFESGADDYLLKPIDALELRSRSELHFRLRDSVRNTTELKSKLNSQQMTSLREQQAQTEEILAIQDVTVLTLAKVAESRDNETGEHLVRLRDYAQRLAEELRDDSQFAEVINDQFLSDLYRSTPLHDIGKVGVPDSILLKPGRLTPAEFEIMKRHAVMGSNVLNEAVMQLSGGGFLTMAAIIARFHHERWDGTGYPAGLVREEIPLPARIVSVADVYDALTSKRPYKDAWPPARAKQTIDEAVGTQFDPAVVLAFDRCFDDILRIQEVHTGQARVAVGAMAFREYEQPQTF